MKYKDAILSIKLKFQSGNSIPAERVIITAEEWEAILARLEKLEKGNK